MNLHNMEYLTDEQMKKEKPLKNVYSKKNNAIVKFLSQGGQSASATRQKASGAKVSVFYTPSTNKIIVLN